MNSWSLFPSLSAPPNPAPPTVDAFLSTHVNPRGTEQAERAHYVTAELNPLLYAWGQYYAATSPSPPPQAPPPPEAGIDPCKVSEGRA